MALKKCSECGSSISDKATVCPKCGCPTEVKKFIRKKRIVIGIMIVVLAIIGFGIYMFMNRPEHNDGYYKDTKWGMTVEEVKQKMSDEAIFLEKPEKIVFSSDDYEGKVNTGALISFDCTNNSLQRVQVTWGIGEGSSYTDSKLVDEYAAKFNDLYGKAQENDGRKSWETAKSRISMMCLMDGEVTISYEDITKTEESE